MERELSLVLAFSASLLSAQNRAPSAPGPQPEAAASPRAATAGPADPRYSASAIAIAADRNPLFDEEGDAVWVSTSDWKAGFGGEGTLFVPFLGSCAARNWPVAIRLHSASVDGIALEVDSAQPQRHELEIDFARGQVIESYTVRDDGLEQSFRIDVLPRRGELQLNLAIGTDLEAREVEGEILFHGPDGGVRYGRAFAVDAVGNQCPVQTRLRGKSITLVVPAEFVTQATLPLVVDPLLETTTTVATVARQTTSVDMAWSESLQRYAVCYERVWSATDSDVFVRLLDASMQPLGSGLVVDASSTSWRKCRIASTETVAQQLVVAEVSAANASPFSVRGRMVVHNPVPTLNPAFDIAVPTAGGPTNRDCTAPDVGGDPAGGPTYFTVVWRQGVSTLDSDILINQINSLGNLRFGTPVVIDNSAAVSVSPKISKSDGVGPFGTQGWAIVYRNYAPVSGQVSLRGAVVSWNGVPRNYGGSSSFEIVAPSTDFESSWDVSSPTDDDGGNRKYLVVHQRHSALVEVLLGTTFDRNGAILNGTTYAVQDIVNHRSVRDPAVDCDGCRFTIGCTKEFSASDDNVLLATIFHLGNVLAAQEELALADMVGDENQVAVVAHHSGGGPRMSYGTSWVRAAAPTTWVVEGRNYAARTPGEIVTRSTGCGSVTIGTSGTPALGVHFTVDAGGTGSAFGILAGTPLNLPIPGCAGCKLGVSGSAYTTTSMAFDIPCTYALIGGVVSFQAFAVGGGSCIASIGLSDTLDVTIR